MAPNHAETDSYRTDGGVEVESAQQVGAANSLERVERRNRILNLRRQGFTHDQIAETLTKGDDEGPPYEITPSGVRSALARYMESLRGEDEETVELLRQLDSERLERMFRRLERDALSQDPDIRRRALLAQAKILERRARLLGLDQPQVHRHEGEVEHHLVADPKHVAAVDASFAKRHGGQVIELPAGNVVEEPAR